MNRFKIRSCAHTNDDDVPDDLGYEGHMITLSCESEPSFVLFFPMSEENSKIINYILNSKQNNIDINTNVLGLYRTMIESWNRGDRYLSGIIMDAIYDQKQKDDIIMIRLVLIDSDGDLDSLVHINFVHAMFLAAMEKTDIYISDQLLVKLVPDAEETLNLNSNNRSKNSVFPEDKELLKIVKDILKNDEERNKKDNKNDKDDKNSKKI